MVAARTSNLKESRYRAEKDGQIDVYTKEEYYGMQGIVQIINSMFSGTGDKTDKPKGAQNMSAMGR